MNETILDQCAQSQQDEIDVLESIYPGQFKILPNPAQKPGKILDLVIPITFLSPITANLLPSIDFRHESTSAHPLSSSSTSSSSTCPDLQLSHLPPINVRIHLPPLYPSSSPPRALSVHARLEGERGNRFPRSILNSISSKVNEMWEEEKAMMGQEGAGIIWKFWEWVGNGDFLSDVGILRGDLLKLTVPPSTSISAFHTSLKAYNSAQLHSSFEQTAFSCTICFENRKGKSCVQMPCGCVFCNPCLNACWTLAITEGTLESVSCPSPACVKRRTTKDTSQGMGPEDLDPDLVKSVVGEEMRDRWEELKERRRAEVDPTYCVCPQPQCQAAVPPPTPPTLVLPPSTSNTNTRKAIRLSEISSSSSSSVPLTIQSYQSSKLPDSTNREAPSTPTNTAPDDRWERYRQCPKCSYSFCLYCSSTWHGVHLPCSFPQTSKIILEYLSHPENSPERDLIERRRGKKNIEKMVAKYLEDESNKEWLEGNTRKCSGCGVRVEKSHGCNHMTCGRCQSHFCFRCGESLRPADPYAHYRRPGTSCFEKLFDQEEIARFERETALHRFDAGFGALPGVDVGDEWGPGNVWEW